VEAHTEQLSVRETEVLERVVLGMTNAQIAHELSVTPHAVKFHLASIYRKLQVMNRTEAAVAYLRHSARTAAPA
jgi:two-component system, NarL family, nitrate/nitrite response regulator NarL